MTDLLTARLRLRAVDAAEAERIAGGRPGPDDAWAADYPFEGDVTGVRMFLLRTGELGEQRPFGYYRVDRLADGLAVGGIGFKGPPEDGRVEIGYGLAPSARGCGYAAEAVTALLGLAARHGVTCVAADTTSDNVASQRTLLRAGFVLVGRDDELRFEARAVSAEDAAR